MCKISKESNLSPLVTQYWEEKGYCVHGEVSVFSKRIFVDHVAHKGSCECPTEVIGIELKLKNLKDLTKQLNTLQRQHVVDEEWGVLASLPSSDSLRHWGYHKKRRAAWANYGLMYWDGDELVILEEPTQRTEAGLKKIKYDKILLVEENRGKTGGVKLAKGETQITNKSIIKQAVLDFLEEKEEALFSEIYEHVLPLMSLYKNPNSYLYQLLKYMMVYYPKYPKESQTLYLKMKKRGKKSVYRLL